MALTPTITRRATGGSIRRRVVDITFDNSYATGGKPFAPGDVELSVINGVDFSHARQGAAYSSNVVRYDAVNGKLLVYTAAGAEIAALTDLSTFVASLIIEGY